MDLRNIISTLMVLMIHDVCSKVQSTSTHFSAKNTDTSEPKFISWSSTSYLCNRDCGRQNPLWVARFKQDSGTCECFLPAEDISVSGESLSEQYEENTFKDFKTFWKFIMKQLYAQQKITRHESLKWSTISRLKNFGKDFQICENGSPYDRSGKCTVAKITLRV